ncbi:MAG: phosphate ABC transporter ATP-binding protein [Pseudomonadota bacterium]|nr:phosphate ABC transporter ATP-binding protein [Pseudomonadota bacterium]
MISELKILPLELNDVSLEINGMRYIKDFNLKLEANTTTIVLGPNGAGKSLFLRLCHGLIKPTVGSVRWLGPEGENPKSHQSMVFQKPIMFKQSVKSNLHFGLKSRKIKKTKRDPIVEQILEITGLSRLASTPARALSIGEQQRLAIGRAWTLRPEVLFLDEPTANLDPAATHVVEEIIGKIKKAGTTIIMSTHDLGQAKRLADNILFLNRGRILENSPAAQFLDKPKNDLAQSFLRGELLWWHRKKLKPPANKKNYIS